MTRRPEFLGRVSAAANPAALLTLLLVGLLALCSRPALAGAEEGRAKAQTCIACHGPGGNSVIPSIPSLTGQPKQFIVSALYQFREGKRKNDQMTPMAANLSNADLNDLAAFFAAQPLAAWPAKTTANLAEGKRLATENNCVACHAANLMGQQHIPRLAGQHKDYLGAQLRSFKASTRGEMDGVMTSAAQALTEADIEVLTDYLAGLPTAP
jgi:cytochrome c553